MKNKKGFTMVELLVVLVIVAILSAVATPIYLANVKRARVSEAVSTMSLIRQALRDYRVNAGDYFDIASGDIENVLATSVVANGTPTPADAGVAIDIGTAQYFSNSAFTVDAGTGLDLDGASGLFTTPPTQDFLITATGDDSDDCTTTEADCATKKGEVAGYILEMDNSGRVYASYDAGTTWEKY